MSDHDKNKARAEGEKQKTALAFILRAIVNDPAIPYQTKINSVIALGSASCAIIAVQPIPFADIFILTPVQMVMIYYLNKIISDDANAEIDATSLLATLGAVAGWRLIVQQIILGLYKTVLSFMGGFTTIPLVYGATSAIGYMGVSVLEKKARDKNFDAENLTPQQQAELERISKQAKKDAKKNKPTLDQLKEFVANAKSDAEKFYNYERKLAQLEQDNQILQNQLNQKQQSYDNQLAKVLVLGGEFAEIKKEMEDEQLELMLKNEELSEENKALLQEYLKAQKELEELKKKSLTNSKTKSDFLKSRMAIYTNIVFEKQSFDEFVLLTDKDHHLAERLIGRLNYSPDKATVRDKIASTDFLEYGFGSQGRLYVKKVGIKYHIYKIGNKATQVNDIKYLKSVN